MNKVFNILFRLNQLFWVVVSMIWYVPCDLVSSLSINSPFINRGLLLLLFFSFILLSSFILFIFYLIRILLKFKEQSIFKMITFSSLSFFLLFVVYSDGDGEISTNYSIIILNFLLILVLISSIFHFILYSIIHKGNTCSNAAGRFKTFLKFVDVYCCYALNNYAYFFVFAITL